MEGRNNPDCAFYLPWLPSKKRETSLSLSVFICVLLGSQRFFRARLRLQRGDRHDVGDILGRAAAGEIVGRAMESLQDRAGRLSARHTLHKLVCNVARVEIRED